MGIKMTDKQTIAEPKKKDSSLGYDFLAGIDPTGVATFRAASKNEKNHAVHRIAGTAGGFLGGTAIGVALPAAVYAGAKVLLKKRMPHLSKTFGQASKDTIKALNPHALYKNVKATPSAARYLSGLSEMPAMMREYQKVSKGPAGMIGAASKIDPKDAKKLRDLQKSEDKLKKMFKGQDPASAAQTAITGLLGVSGGLGSGVLNAASAHSQYNAALKERGLDSSGRPYAAQPKK